MGIHRNDILWSAALEDFFIEFLRFFFIDADNIFDLSKGFTFLDKTLAEIFPGKDLKHPKIVDKLVRVHLKNGGDKWVLVHIEVQGYKQALFTKRMFTYYYRILEKYNMPVTSVVIYLGKRNKFNNSFYSSDFLGTKIRFDFNAFYVGEQKEEDLQKSENPFAVIVLTALYALKRKRNVQVLFDHKMAIAKQLLRAGFNKDKTRKLFNFIRLYIDFGENELSNNFENEIELLTNKNSETMGIIEQVRELLKERAKRQGWMEGNKEGKIAGIKAGREKGKKEGKKEGRIEGKIQGERQARSSIAKKLKSSGIPMDLITECTGLSLQQVKML